MIKAALAILNQLDAAVVDEASGRVYVHSIDLTEELETVIELTVRRCINAADCVNDDKETEWDRGVRAAIRQIKTEFGMYV